jgi:hypothetical protein
MPCDSEDYEKVICSKSYPATWNATMDETGFICTIAGHIAHYLYDKERSKELKKNKVTRAQYSQLIEGNNPKAKRKGPVVELLGLIEKGYGLKLTENNLLLQNLLTKLLDYSKNGKIPPQFTEPYNNPIKRLILRIGSRYYKRSAIGREKIHLMVKQIVKYIDEPYKKSDDKNRHMISRTLDVLYDHVTDIETESKMNSRDDDVSKDQVNVVSVDKNDVAQSVLYKKWS